MKNLVRVASVQYEMKAISSWDEFALQTEYFVRVASEYRAHFVLFPELFTLQLLSFGQGPALPRLTELTPRLQDWFCELARRYQIHVIVGSHPSGQENICLFCLKDGRVQVQPKIHATPSERENWGIVGGNQLSPIDTEFGPVGVLICYDSEFPELTRHLVDQGVRLLFVPFCTDERQGYLRVRYCCQARAVENQIYVVMAGTVGNLRGVPNMDLQYAQSCVLTPCDFPFAREGVAAEASPNVEMLLVAELDLSLLDRARQEGTVRNLRDRRHDLYRVSWHAR